MAGPLPSGLSNAYDKYHIYDASIRPSAEKRQWMGVLNDCFATNFYRATATVASRIIK